MRRLWRGSLVLSITVLLQACSNSQHVPTAPSALVDPGSVANSTAGSPLTSTTSVLDWACGQQTSASRTVNGWTFDPPIASCAATRFGRLATAAAAVSAAPGNFRASVSGNVVQLDWTAIAEPVISHQLEAGSGPGLSDLAIFNTGTSAATVTVNNVPAGVYYARVRAVGPDNLPGPASNEIIVRVGACGGPPGPPANLTSRVTGNQVTLTWTASGGDAAASSVVEAGSSPGQSNVIVFDTGSVNPTLTAAAPNGVYYVRVRARNACGLGPASNEVVVSVPGGGGGTVPPPATEPPWTPPPAPEPPGPPPPIATLVPDIQVSVPIVAPPQIVAGPPPRPEAGVGPPVDVTLIAAPTPTTRRVRVTSSRPVDTLILAGDTRVAAQSIRVGDMAVAESYYLVRLQSPQTVVELTLTVTQSFTGQIAARLGTGPVGDYKPVTLTGTSSGPVNVTGTWGFGADEFTTEDYIVFRLTQSGNRVTGRMEFPGIPGYDAAGIQWLIDGTITGSNLVFTLRFIFPQAACEGVYIGNTQVTGNTMTGTLSGTYNCFGESIPIAEGPIFLRRR